MSQVERRMYVYTVEAIRLEAPDESSKEFERLEADISQVFDSLENLV